jgi:hypothetical protein
MHAKVGDRLIMEGVHVGDPKRIGVISAVSHADGTPPYTVKWVDSERETLVYPGSECHIEQAEQAG